MSTENGSLEINGSRSSDRVMGFLYVGLSFFAGAGVMVIELAGIRLLSPLFGTSIYTWTALIGVVLVAASVGGYLGGWLADRSVDNKVLGLLLFLSAISTVLISPVYTATAPLFESLGLVAGPTVLSLILFTVPGCFLGAVQPYATRLLAHLSQDTRIGFAAGASNMSGLLGSFIGTVASGFVLIPMFDIATIFVGTTLVLLLLCAAVYWCSDEWPASDRVLLAAPALVFAVVAFAMVRPGYPEKVIDHRQSAYQQILVTEEVNDNNETVRWLYNDAVAQGALNVDTGVSPLPYQHYWELSKVYLDDMRMALIVGGGTFGIPKDLSQGWPNAVITALEIDPVVVRVAEEQFMLGEYEIEVVEEDARFYMNRTSGTYDLIFGDAYGRGRTIPAHLTTREFFSQIEGRLSPGGVYMMNVISALNGPHAEVFGAVLRTLRDVFPDVHVYRAYDRPDDRINNLIVVASNDLANPDSSNYLVDSGIGQLLNTRVEESQLPVSDTVLTDWKNPIELLVARALGNS